MIKIINPTPTPKTDRLEHIEEKGGLYLLYNAANALLYIGQSEDLWDRIREQLQVIEGVRTFAVVYEEDPYKRAIYEISMINELKPRLNKKHAFYKK